MREIITTDRLTLRRPAHADAPVMARLLNDPDILRMTASLPQPFFTLAAEFWIMKQTADWQRGLSYAYVITNQNDGFMGVMDLFTNCDGDWEIGYWLARDYWGHGYITEAASAVISEGFRVFDLAFVDAGYFVDNPASGRVLDKLGFISKNEPSNLYSVARAQRCAGIELRLGRKTAMNKFGFEDKQAIS